MSDWLAEKYWDRQGQPIDEATFRAHRLDWSYRRLGQQALPDGKYVSTVWLGRNEGLYDDMPVIFETIVFASKGPGGDPLETDRYHTEQEALTGHAALMEKYLTELIMDRKAVKIDYTNHRGERAVRVIEPLRWHWGSTQWHPENQWLLEAYDHKQSSMRDFALSGIHAWEKVDG
jgi:hypothetical protein